MVLVTPAEIKQVSTIMPTLHILALFNFIELLLSNLMLLLENIWPFNKWRNA